MKSKKLSQKNGDERIRFKGFVLTPKQRQVIMEYNNERRKRNAESLEKLFCGIWKLISATIRFLTLSVICATMGYGLIKFGVSAWHSCFIASMGAIYLAWAMGWE